MKHFILTKGTRDSIEFFLMGIFILFMLALGFIYAY